VSATPFVIVCFGRTGSSWLCSLLQSHPGILCHGEIFSPKGIRFAPGYLDRSPMAATWTVASRDSDPEKFLEAVLSEDLGHQAVGFKMLNWMQPDLMLRLARSQAVHKVILRRQNRVRAFLSRTRSEALERWQLESYHGSRVRLDPAELVAYVKRYERFYDELRAAATGTPVLEVVYEELLEDDRCARGIVEFLGATPSDVPLRSRLFRQSHDLTRDVVINFEELSVLLHGTALQAELNS
jgi:LPS sulfotransferase NodH